jgi:hypothetical protein
VRNAYQLLCAPGNGIEVSRDSPAKIRRSE